LSALLYRRLLNRHRKCKAIADSRNRDDRLAIFINEDFANCCKVHPNIALAHIRVWPDSRCENFTGHYMPCIFSGVWWKGKSEVFGTLDRYRKTIFKDRKLYPAEKLSIRQIAPNVIVSTMINPADAYTNSSGVTQPPTRNVLTLIWVKREDNWLIAQAQNTIELPTGAPAK
jgi:hypothetical protein